ncbi:hypothetical protein NDU88_003216 [Pleurodeles waltl]|uniref:Uncharacterized protein n=1 Tax=Pleurodeles waltl TaxID=8319 RepID=A0AAV7W5F3_PLEWA|nr:hypothetical protein NDU88_003216 [Pleurodeles waltl]
MEQDPKILEAVALLRQAGRLDLLVDGALAPERPARRASAGVAAAVAACSPPRSSGGRKVSGAARGAGAKGVLGAGSGRPRGRAVGRGSLRLSREAGQGLDSASRIPAHRAKAGPLETVCRAKKGREGAAQRGGNPSGSMGRGKAGARLPRAAASRSVLGSAGRRGAAATAQRAFMLPGTGQGPIEMGGDHIGAGGKASEAVSPSQGAHFEPCVRQAERDPKVPVSRKWSTMLQWSSDEEGGSSPGAKWYEDGAAEYSSLGVSWKAGREVSQEQGGRACVTCAFACVSLSETL